MAAQAPVQPVPPLTPAVLARIDALSMQLSPGQRLWASGYLAARAASPAPAADDSVTILYASQTGNGEALAQNLQADLTQQGLQPRCLSMADYPPARLKREHRLLLIVSTQGDGDPPDDAEGLHAFLHSPQAPRLERLRYGVLALGDSSYSHFCRTGREFDARLAALGATSLMPRLDCDLDYQPMARRWAGETVELLKNSVATKVAVVTPVASVMHDVNSPFVAEVMALHKITGRGSERKTWHLALSLEGSGIDYLPGDSIGLRVDNPDDLVNEILEITGLEPNALVTLGDDSIQLAEALRARLELTLVSRTALQQLCGGLHQGSTPPWAGEGRAFLDYVALRQLPDVLRESGVSLHAQGLVDLLRPRTPRLYSIASSPLAVPDEVHLALTLEQTPSGRPGLTTGAVSHHLAPGDSLPVHLHRNQRFHLPEDPDTPIIMIGPGVGVAPFRAFLQHREARAEHGDNWLFFGARHQHTDFLYQIDWLRWRKRGLLTRLDVAFSRDQARRIHVQQRMCESGAELYRWLERGATVYVCGDAAAMAGDVDTALRSIVARHGARDEDAAADYLRAMKQARRYLRDVY